MIDHDQQAITYADAQLAAAAPPQLLSLGGTPAWGGWDTTTVTIARA